MHTASACCRCRRSLARRGAACSCGGGGGAKVHIYVAVCYHSRALSLPSPPLSLPPSPILPLSLQLCDSVPVWCISMHIHACMHCSVRALTQICGQGVDAGLLGAVTYIAMRAVASEVLFRREEIAAHRGVSAGWASECILLGRASASVGAVASPAWNIRNQRSLPLTFHTTHAWVAMRYGGSCSEDDATTAPLPSSPATRTSPVLQVFCCEVVTCLRTRTRGLVCRSGSGRHRGCNGQPSPLALDPKHKPIPRHGKAQHRPP